MRAVVVSRHGGPEVLEPRELPEPEAGVGEVLVDLRAAALNRRDTFVRSGVYDFPVAPATNQGNPASTDNQVVTVTSAQLQVAAGLADLSITKSDSPDPVAINGTITYTIGVSNAGPDDASAVKVVDAPAPTFAWSHCAPLPQGDPTAMFGLCPRPASCSERSCTGHGHCAQPNSPGWHLSRVAFP